MGGVFAAFTLVHQGVAPLQNVVDVFPVPRAGEAVAEAHTERIRRSEAVVLEDPFEFVESVVERGGIVVELDHGEFVPPPRRMT